MKLSNTLTRKVDEFSPTSSVVKIYSCGPTVYNYAHIGNLSSYIYADILRRAVKLTGYEVQHVMNLTDVDDKTIRDSQKPEFLAEFREKFPELEATPNNLLAKFTEKYSQIFLREMQEVGNITAEDLDADEIDNPEVFAKMFRKNPQKFDGFNFTRATKNIAGIQALIKKLLREKVAYVADDGIYFSISEYRKTRKYGQLSEINNSDTSISRTANDEYDKDSAQDFALWKSQKSGEPAWDFEFDDLGESEITWAKERQSREDFVKKMPGRPGWHIECSVMSTRFLGQPFDIHTGGVDLIFPHHENEIAQSTAGNQPEVLAEFFVHSEHLLVDGKKMSKSENNFYTLNDLKSRGFSPLDFRMLVLQSHYKSATNFSWENLAAAKNRLANWKNFANLRWQEFNEADARDDGSDLNSVTNLLLNNLDTPNALAQLDQLISVKHSTKLRELIIDFIDSSLGLNLRKTTRDITDSEKEMIKLREDARHDKDWAESDRLRDELLNEHKLIIDDTANGPIWSRNYSA